MDFKSQDAFDAYNKKHGTTTKKTERVLVKEGTEGTEGYYKDNPSQNIHQEASINTGGIPFTLRGNPMFRNFGIGGEPKKK